jgi:hypothetical protein
MRTHKRHLLLLVMALACAQPVLAQDSTATSASTSTLQGGVKGTTISLPVFLSELRDNCRHMIGTSKVLLAEVERQDMVAVGGPNLIGNMVIPATPSPSGVVSMGALPPRKKWLDFFTAQMQQLVTMTETENDGLVAGDLSAGASADLTELRGRIHNLIAEQKALADSIVGPKYDNTKIGACATNIQDEVKQIEKLRSKLQRQTKRKSR